MIVKKGLITYSIKSNSNSYTLLVILVDRMAIKKSIVNFIFKTLMVAVITLILLIIMKTNVKFKTMYYKYVYDNSITFTKFNNLYNKYFKDLSIKDIVNKDNTNTVSDEKLSYSKQDKYKDGVKLTVGTNYSIPVLESGIIVYIGNKDDYGSTIIVQQINGIDLLYGNIENTNYKLYDYVKKNDILGTSNKYLYLVYKKDGKVLDYEKYL